LAQKAIYTIGYGARTIEELVSVLRHYDIAYLIDVRSQPYSRFKPEYTKHALERKLKEDAIRYVFMGESLGGRPHDKSCYTASGTVDYAILREKSFYKEGIERLRVALAKDLHVVLMCSEGKPQECHRSKLLGVTLAAEGIEVLHIDENGNTLTQDEVIYDITHGQQSLFGPAEMEFTSRKKYDTP
jgi:uncharacterized protein (DUF488 family)